LNERGQTGSLPERVLRERGAKDSREKEYVDHERGRRKLRGATSA